MNSSVKYDELASAFLLEFIKKQLIIYGMTLRLYVEVTQGMVLSVGWLVGR